MDGPWSWGVRDAQQPGRTVKELEVDQFPAERTVRELRPINPKKAPRFEGREQRLFQRETRRPPGQTGRAAPWRASGAWEANESS